MTIYCMALRKNQEIEISRPHGDETMTVADAVKLNKLWVGYREDELSGRRAPAWIVSENGEKLNQVRRIKGKICAIIFHTEYENSDEKAIILPGEFIEYISSAFSKHLNSAGRIVLEDEDGYEIDEYHPGFIKIVSGIIDNAKK